MKTRGDFGRSERLRPLSDVASLEAVGDGRADVVFVNL
jgi:hypothetical protein